jgi:predicted metal-binding protein
MKMNLSNGRCYLCKESNIQEDLHHLFFKCIIFNRFISNITILINTFLALSIVSLQLAVSKIFSSDFKVCFHILQSTFWKCNHNIIYTESRHRKMNLSNGRCHLCKESNIQEDLQHLFFKCIISNRFVIESSIFWIYLLYHYN